MTLDSLIRLEAYNHRSLEFRNNIVQGVDGFPGNGLIYNCEVSKLIPPENGSKKPKYQYCKSKSDFEGMGISVIGVHDLLTDKTKYYTEDYFDDFQRLVDNRNFVIGFNSIAFDDVLCAAHGIRIGTSYDIYREIRVATEQTPWYTDGESRPGYTLHKICKENLGSGKPPIPEGYKYASELWQDDKHQAVIDYCLCIVDLTKKIWFRREELIDPTNGWTIQLSEYEYASEDYYLEVLAEAIGWPG